MTSPEKESYNYMRTVRMAAWGTLIGGPILAVWYRSLHTAMESLSVSYAPVVGTRLAWLAERTPAMSWVADLHKPEVVKVSAGRMLLGKVVLDTTLFQAPFLNLYFGVMGALEGLSASEIYEKTKASFHRAWALCFLVWTPVQVQHAARLSHINRRRWRAAGAHSSRLLLLLARRAAACTHSPELPRHSRCSPTPLPLRPRSSAVSPLLSGCQPLLRARRLPASRRRRRECGVDNNPLAAKPLP